MTPSTRKAASQAALKALKAALKEEAPGPDLFPTMVEAAIPVILKAEPDTPDFLLADEVRGVCLEVWHAHFKVGGGE